MVRRVADCIPFTREGKPITEASFAACLTALLIGRKLLQESLFIAIYNRLASSRILDRVGGVNGFPEALALEGAY